jgi:Ser-tRNA(Ala) deacylase AlaX
MTKRLYYSTNELTVRATVVEIGHDENGTWVVPDQTVAHVKGGGQRADRGTIGGAALKDVVAREGRNGAAYHYIEGTPLFAVGDAVEIKVDPEWRRRQAVSHDGGHLIAAVVEEHFHELKAVSGHHYEGEARVEFVGNPPSDLAAFQTTLEAALKQAIDSDLPIQIIGDPFVNRAVQIGTYPPVPCGGTHPVSTRELGRIEIKSVKNKGGKFRVSYETCPNPHS